MEFTSGLLEKIRKQNYIANGKKRKRMKKLSQGKLIEKLDEWFRMAIDAYLMDGDGIDEEKQAYEQIKKLIIENVDREWGEKKRK